MGTLKNYHFVAQLENCIEWIRQQHRIDIADAGHEQGDGVSANCADFLDAAAIATEREWLTLHSYTQIFDEFSAELATLSGLLPAGER